MSKLGLLALNTADENYLQLLLDLPFTHSEQKEVLRNLEEVCLRDSLSLSECLKPILSENASSITNLETEGSPEFKPSPHARAKYIRSALHQLRFPLLAEQELRFAEWKAGLKFPPDITIQHSPNFEQDWLEVRFRYKSKEHLQQIINKLQNILTAS